MTKATTKKMTSGMGTIETYHITSEGSNPFLVRDSWQMVKLNYSKEHSILAIEKLYKHEMTDKGIALMSGKVCLVVMEVIKDRRQFQMELLKKGVCYNVPKNSAYFLIMDEDAELIFVEQNNTHLNDTHFVELSRSDIFKINEMFNSLKTKHQ